MSLPRWFEEIRESVMKSPDPRSAWRALREYPDCRHILPEGKSMPEPEEFLRQLPHCVDNTRELAEAAGELARWVLETRLYLLSAQIVPILKGDEATAFIRPIGVDETKTLLQKGFISAVGHAGTAEILSALFGMEVPKQRIEAFLKPGDKAIQFVLGQRQAEGVVLDREAVEKIGYTLMLVHRVK